MEIIKVDHTDNINLLLAQFKEAPNLTGILRVNDEQANLFQDAIFEVRDLYWIDTAEGAQLDVIGSILNSPRAGKTDFEYRISLKGIVTLSFSGTPEEVLNAVKSTYGLTNLSIFFCKEDPAVFYLYSTEDPGVGHSELEKWTPAGVLGLWIEPIYHGSLSEDDYLVDANGDLICSAFQAQVFEAITGDGDFLIWDDGVSVAFVSME